MPYVKMRNKKIYYDEFGNGKVIIFLHPPGMGRTTFVKQQALSKFFRLILPDLSGHGDSPTLEDTITIQTYLEEIEGIRTHLKVDEVYLFGYSAGGIIAQEYAIQFPNHVKGVILSGGYPKVDTEFLKIEHLIGIYLAKHFPKVLAKCLSISHFSDGKLQHTLYQQILRSNSNIWVGFYEQSLYFNCVDRLNQLQAPLMLLYSTGPDYINYHVRLYQNLIDTEIHFIQALGHQLPTRKYRQVNEYIQQFIQRIEQTQLQ